MACSTSEMFCVWPGFNAYVNDGSLSTPPVPDRWKTMRPLMAEALALLSCTPVRKNEPNEPGEEATPGSTPRPGFSTARLKTENEGSGSVTAGALEAENGGRY